MGDPAVRLFQPDGEGNRWWAVSWLSVGICSSGLLISSLAVSVAIGEIKELQAEARAAKREAQDARDEAHQMRREIEAMRREIAGDLTTLKLKTSRMNNEPDRRPGGGD
jgi:hypothetical protein